MVSTFLSEKPVDIHLLPENNLTSESNGWVIAKAGFTTRRIRFTLTNLYMVAKGLSWHTHRRLLKQFQRAGLDVVEFCLQTTHGQFRYSTNFKDKLNQAEPPTAS